MFPKLRRRSPHGSCESVSDKEEDEATDYVFRILLPSTQSDFGMLFGVEFSVKGHYCFFCILDPRERVIGSLNPPFPLTFFVKLYSAVSFAS